MRVCRSRRCVMYSRSVNKKALDQYQSFTEQRADLVRRTQENDRAEEKIRELISTLDLRKDEAIERTFKVSQAMLPGLTLLCAVAASLADCSKLQLARLLCAAMHIQVLLQRRRGCSTVGRLFA